MFSLMFDKSTGVAAGFLVLVLVACADQGQDEDGTGGQGSTDSRPQELRGKCPPLSRIGGFQVAHEPSGSYVSGEVADAVLPVSVPTELSSSGSCRLLRKNNPYCDPPCTSGQFCVDNGTCIPYPRNQDLGQVFVSGLVQPIVMDPAGSGNQYFDTSLPHPAFEPGSPIKLSAMGGDLDGFTLYGDGVAPIKSIDPVWSVRPQEELAVNWEADIDHETIVAATLNIDQHGLSPATIVCEGSDTGSLLVSAELIDRLLDLGISGFPTATLRRYTVDSIQLDAGCVDLTVFSSIPVEATVASHIPCAGPDDCPEGKSCDLDSNICV